MLWSLTTTRFRTADHTHNYFEMLRTRTHALVGNVFRKIRTALIVWQCSGRIWSWISPRWVLISNWSAGSLKGRIVIVSQCENKQCYDPDVFKVGTMRWMSTTNHLMRWISTSNHLALHQILVCNRALKFSDFLANALDRSRLESLLFQAFATFGLQMFYPTIPVTFRRVSNPWLWAFEHFHWCYCQVFIIRKVVIGYWYPCSNRSVRLEKSDTPC